MSTLSFTEAISWAQDHPSAINWSEFLQDITRQAREGATVDEFSTRQVDAYTRCVAKQIDRFEERTAARQAEEAKLANAPRLRAGRQEVVGRFVHYKEVHTAYGDSLKGLFLTDEGNKIWMSVPQIVDDTSMEREVDIKDLRITLNVAITPKEPHFGFGNRPTKVQVWPTDVEEQEAISDAEKAAAAAQDEQDAADYEAEKINERAGEDSAPDEDLTNHADYSAQPISQLNVLWSERDGTVHNDTLPVDEARTVLDALLKMETTDDAAGFNRAALIMALQVAFIRAKLSPINA